MSAAGHGKMETSSAIFKAIIVVKAWLLFHIMYFLYSRMAIGECRMITYKHVENVMLVSTKKTRSQVL